MKGIIFHYGLFKIVWDWFVLLLVLYTAIEVPFLIAFIVQNENSEESSNLSSYLSSGKATATLVVVDLCVDLFFFCDIVVNFRTTYIGKNDALVTDPKKIALRYLRTYFIVDFVAAIPWDIIAVPAHESTTSLSLLKTVRLLRLFQAARRLDQNYEKSVSLLFLMVFAFSLVAHWLACIWYTIGYSENKRSIPNSWLTELAINNEEPFNKTAGLYGPSLRARYLTSLYFTLTCLTSVGFGNVSANTDFEKLFTILSMLIGALLFAAVFGNVSAIIYGHYSGTFKFRERMQSVKYFLGFHKIKGPLARKVKDYARHMWTQTKGISTMKVMKQFPKNLQEEISCYLHFNVIKNCPLFESAEESFLWSLATRMIRLHHLPNNIIIRQGSIVESIYFINRGRLDVCRNEIVVGTLGEGDAFGNLNLTPNSGVHKSAVMLRCSCCVDIHILNVSDLKEVLRIFPKFSKNLRQKTSTIMKKTVLTSQILSSWDAMELEDTCSEHQSLHLFTTWLGRQRVKRNCGAHGHESQFSKKKSKKGGINETLVTLPLCVLNSTCSSSDDVQKRWRFANIIESSKGEQINGLLLGNPNNGKIDENHSDDAFTDVSEQRNSANEQSESLCHHRRCRNTSHKRQCDDEIAKNRDSGESITDSLRHSRCCDLNEIPSDDDNENGHTKLETTIHDMNEKLQILEKKMDAILAFVEQQNTSTNC
ncbi:potassium voltage-gated channel subfamily H member 6-like isoform X2 [Dendronephthya gigantea]|nr:potassium voltage-gated channel subfamily H member 6-like isoform X2 [Dendronephthya gigantea]XP_028397827.1 potassium voltage-gated channel subfamily H member 6-like isoform X2 [Dendronephthya gigantea]